MVRLLRLRRPPPQPIPDGRLGRSMEAQPTAARIAPTGHGVSAAPGHAASRSDGGHPFRAHRRDIPPLLRRKRIHAARRGDRLSATHPQQRHVRGRRRRTACPAGSIASSRRTTHSSESIRTRPCSPTLPEHRTKPCSVGPICSTSGRSRRYFGRHRVVEAGGEYYEQGPLALALVEVEEQKAKANAAAGAARHSCGQSSTTSVGAFCTARQRSCCSSRLMRTIRENRFVIRLRAPATSLTSRRRDQASRSRSAWLDPTPKGLGREGLAPLAHTCTEDRRAKQDLRAISRRHERSRRSSGKRCRTRGPR